MRSYYRVILGAKNVYAQECFDGGYIGTDFGIHSDLSNNLPEDWRVFNKEFIPVFLKSHPEKTTIGAGLACGALWTVSKGISEDDIVLCPDGTGRYRVGKILGPYSYEPGKNLFHRRPVEWLAASIEKTAMSDSLKNSAGSIGTVSNLSQYRDELETLMKGAVTPLLIAGDESVIDPLAFALEAHLEAFLVKNWSHTELGNEFAIYEEDGEKAQQYPTDTGRLDILAISKDKKTFLVVELKKGRVSDAVVGQTLRYVAFIRESLANKDQTVHGAIIALDDDQKIRRALSMVQNLHFYRYKIDFSLEKA